MLTRDLSGGPAYTPRLFACANVQHMEMELNFLTSSEANCDFERFGFFNELVGHKFSASQCKGPSAKIGLYGFGAS